MLQTRKLSSLKFDPDFYVRQNVDDNHVRRLIKSYKSGTSTFPPIVIDQNNHIIDGVHRHRMYKSEKVKEIECEVRHYKNDKERVRDSILLNRHGLKLESHDELKAIDIAKKAGFEESEIATLFNYTLPELKRLTKRTAFFDMGGKDEKIVALKASIRHLAGRELTKRQEQAIPSAPGQSYFLHVQQLISAIEDDLIPTRTERPLLWAKLDILRKLLNKKFASKFKKSA